MANFVTKKTFAEDFAQDYGLTWVVFGSDIFVSTRQKIYRSTNGGASFNIEYQVSTNPTSHRIYLYEHDGRLWAVDLNHAIGDTKHMVWNDPALPNDFRTIWVKNFLPSSGQYTPQNYNGNSVFAADGAIIHFYTGMQSGGTGVNADFIIKQQGNTFTLVKEYLESGPSFPIKAKAGTEHSGVFYILERDTPNNKIKLVSYDGSTLTDQGEVTKSGLVYGVRSFGGTMYYLSQSDEFGSIGLAPFSMTPIATPSVTNSDGLRAVLKELDSKIWLVYGDATFEQVVHVSTYDGVTFVEDENTFSGDFGDMNIEGDEIIIGYGAGSNNIFVGFTANDCDLAFNDPAFNVTHETAPGANDGTITLLASSSFTIEYSINGVDFFASNNFTGLAPGSYTGYIRDNNPTGCGTLTTSPIVVNAALDCGALSPVLDQTPLNRHNFINWFSITDLCAAFTEFNPTCINECFDLPNEYQLNWKHLEHYPVITPGEITSFYINFETPIDSDITDWRLALIDKYGIVQDNVGTLQQDFYSNGVDFNLYSDVTIPAVTEDTYRFMIYDNGTGLAVYVSNEMQLLSNANAVCRSLRMIYRSSINLYNYKYEDVPNFTNKIRLKINAIEPLQPEGDLSQYRAQSTGKLRNVSLELDKFVVLETYYFNLLAHEGMLVLHAHDTILLNGKNYLPKSLYTISYDARFKVAKGTIEMYEQDFSTCNRFGKIEDIIIVGSDDPLLQGDGGSFIKL